MHYSSPFRLYLITDPETGRRYQRYGRKKGAALAEDIADRTQKPLETILTPSRCFYVLEYCRGGKRGRRVNTHQGNRTLAREWVNDRIRRDSGPCRRANLDLEAAIDQWLEEKRLRRRTTKTLVNYRSQAGFWTRFFGVRQTASITRADIIEFFTWRERGRNGRKPGNHLLNLNLTLLRDFFRWAKKRGYSDADPTEGIERWDELYREPRILSPEEVTGLLTACREPFSVPVVRRSYKSYEKDVTYTPPPWLYPIVLTALTTLLRQKNILALTWGQVDLRAGMIRIPAEESKTRTELAIPISAQLRQCLEDIPRGFADAPVFGVKLASVRRSFTSAVRRAGLEGVTFHCLRKTGTDFLLRSGISLETTQKLGGWKTPEVMLKHYRNPSLQELDEAVTCIDSLVRQAGA